MAGFSDIPSGFSSKEDRWVADSNESLHLQLVRSEQDLLDEESSLSEEDAFFSPDFTYPFYGQEEKIFGLEDLSVQLRFTAASLRPWITIQFRAKRPAVQEDQVVLAPLLEHMFPLQAAHCSGNADKLRRETRKLKLWTEDGEEFRAWLREDAEWKPVGELVHSYQAKDGQEFQIYKSDFDTPGFKEFHRRLQVFLLWYIEGASFIEETDPRWEIYTVYEVKEGRYSTVGYVTCYPFYHYPDKLRMRISQFLILPPYQGQGHGGRLYRFLYERFLENEEIVEVTVEDPSEGFSDMRIKHDLRLLLREKAFSTTPSSTTSVSSSTTSSDAIHKKKKDSLLPLLPTAEQIAKIGSKYKFSKPHMVQLAELYALHSLKTNQGEPMRAYRLWVKKRIYRKNEEVLEAMDDKNEVKRKVAEAYQNVEEEYRRILKALS